jgi:hypothetical protein
MPDLEEDDVLDTDTASQGAKELEMEKRLTMVEAKTERESGALAKILADPQVREVLEARTAGRKIKVVGEEAEPADMVEVPESKDLEAMTNAELVRHILGQVTHAVAGVVDKKIGSLSTDLDSVKGFVRTSQTTDVSKQIQSARDRWEDFDDQREKMLELSGANPGLGVEDLYVLAKARKGELPMVRRVAGDGTPSSEKPTHTGARPTKRKVPLPPGRQGFDQLLSEALGKLDLEAEG